MEKYVNLELEIIEICDDIVTASNNETTPIPWTPGSGGSNKTAPKPYEVYELDDLNE